jgi:hypothetical protein
MRVRDRGTAFGVGSEKVEHVFYCDVRIFFIDYAKFFCCIVEMQRV